LALLHVALITPALSTLGAGLLTGGFSGQSSGEISAILGPVLQLYCAPADDSEMTQQAPQDRSSLS
jgi:hypothetical protein